MPRRGVKAKIVQKKRTTIPVFMEEKGERTVHCFAKPVHPSWAMEKILLGPGKNRRKKCLPIPGKAIIHQRGKKKVPHKPPS